MRSGFIFTDGVIFEKNTGIEDIETKEGVIISEEGTISSCIYQLDGPVAPEIWKMISSAMPVRILKQRLLEKYHVDEARLDTELRSFLEKLYSKKLIRVSAKCRNTPAP